MHLLYELFTLAAFAASAAHAGILRGREGLGLFAALTYLGFVRETFVALYDVLYGFAPLTLMLGPAPLLAAIIWGFSIYAAVSWVELTGGVRLEDDRWPLRPYAAAGLFMVALAGFYEPFLGLVGMAKWEAGTRLSWGVPWIALVGYPTLCVGFLWLWRWTRRRRSQTWRAAGLLPALTALALLHAWGLKGLKDLLGW